jgi:hypothetical protein
MNEIVISPDDTDAINEVDSKEATHPPLVRLMAIESDLIRKAATPPYMYEKPGADCHRTFNAFHQSGRRPLSQISWIVMHSTEGGTARSVGSYFESTQSGGSAHIIVDDLQCYRSLDNTQIPWGARGANYHGFHIEQCGYASWKSVVWTKDHRRTLNRAAYKAAYHCVLFGIPVVFRDYKALKMGQKGITTHIECTRAFGGSHHDPGTGWPRWLFMNMVRTYVLAMKRSAKAA